MLMRVRRALGCAVAAAAVAATAGLASGCGGSGSADRPSAGTAATATQPPAPPLSARTPVSGLVPTVTPAQFRRPIAVYRGHVRRELAAMLTEVGALRRAIDARDLPAARRAWLAADARYETIGAAYGAFGDLDAAINGRPAGLPGGERSADFSGLHRIELALWRHGSTREAAPYAARLVADVRRLRAAVGGTLEIDPLEYSLRAHEVLEDTLHLQLSGQASSGSADALVALAANVAGTRVVLASLRPLIVDRNPAVAHESAVALDAVDAAVQGLRRPGGGLPRWDALSQRQRERIAGLTAAAAEQLAYVPELVDPRPPRAPVASSSGGTTR
jgi:iron uptake system EfeUOB component EfeO/EfeM